MVKYNGEKKSGKIGQMIYSSWHGRPYMRRMPETVTNPRTEAQQAHRNAFAAVSRLSSDLKEAHLIGLHQQALRQKLDTYSVFKKLNKWCYADGSIHYPTVIVSKGPVRAVRIESVEVDELRVLRMTFSGEVTEEDVGDTLHLFIYCAELRDCRSAVPVLRADGVATMQLPEEWADKALHLYVFLRDGKGRTSETMYAAL